MKTKTLVAVILVVGLLLVTGLLVVLSYNGAVGKEQSVNESLSQIKNRYKTKLDILPDLLTQVNQYEFYEQNLLTNITALRTQWMNEYNSGSGVGELANTSSRLDANYTQFVITVENYPNIKADALVSQYMGEVVDLNEQLSYSRAQYNSAVRSYNTFIKSFPNNMFVGPFGFSERSYWGTELPDGEVLNL